MQRHLDTLLHATLDHRAHDEDRRADDLRFVGRNGEPEVLEQVDHDSLHLDQSVGIVSVLMSTVEKRKRTKSASRCTRERRQLWKLVSRESQGLWGSMRTKCHPGTLCEWNSVAR